MRNIEKESREPARLERRTTYVEIDGVHYRKETLRRYDDNGFLLEEREVLTRVNDGQRVSLRLERFGFYGQRVLESVFIEYDDHSKETIREVIGYGYDRRLRLEKVKYSRFLFGNKETEVVVSHNPETGRPLELTRSLYKDGDKVSEESRRLDAEEEEFEPESVNPDDSEPTKVHEIEEAEETKEVDAVSISSRASPQLGAADPVSSPVPTPPPAEQSPPQPRQVAPAVVPLIYAKYWSNEQKDPQQQNDKPPPPTSKPIQSPMPDTPVRRKSPEPVASGDSKKKRAPKEGEEPEKGKVTNEEKTKSLERQLAAALVLSLPEQTPKKPDSSDKLAAPNVVDLPPPLKEAHKEDKEALLFETEAEHGLKEDKEEANDSDKPEAVDLDPTTLPSTLPKPQNIQSETELPVDATTTGQNAPKPGRNVWIAIILTVAVLLMVALLFYLYLG